MRQNVKIYDALIIGSGSAGLACGTACLRYGLNVLVIPGREPKATSMDTIESIHPGVESLLFQLDFSPVPESAIKGKYNFISNGLQRKSLNPYDEELWTGFHISKQPFNNYLLYESRLQGLKILDGISVNGIIRKNDRVIGVSTSDGQKLYAKYIVDASGSKSISTTDIKLSKSYSSIPYFVLAGRASGIKNLNPDKFCAYFLNRQQGWSWIAPLQDNSFYWTRLLVNPNKISISIALENFELPVIVRSAYMQWRIYSPVAFEGLFLCGDAACLIDPAGGQGILNALKQGLRVGYTLKAYLDNPKLEAVVLSDYNNWLITEYHNKTKQLREVYDSLGIS